jgi:putative transposase
MQYRRARTAGGTFFFTVNLAERDKTLLIDNIGFLRLSVKQTKTKHPFIIDGIVILPDHLHTIWTLPPNDSDFSTRWRLIKSGFSRALPKTERINSAREKKSERGIWQRRFWEHQIRDETDFIRHMDYLNYNPVKHGYVNSVKDWPYSSFHLDVKKGLYARDWGSDVELLLSAKDVGDF